MTKRCDIELTEIAAGKKPASQMARESRAGEKLRIALALKQERDRIRNDADNHGVEYNEYNY